MCASIMKSVSDKNVNYRQRADPTVHPLGGRVGSATGDVYPLRVCRENRDPEVS